MFRRKEIPAWVLLTAFFCFFVGCSLLTHSIQPDAWSATAISVYGGSMLGSQGEGHVARREERSSTFFALLDKFLLPVLSPIPFAQAANPLISSCPQFDNTDANLASCHFFGGFSVSPDTAGADLRLYYNLCEFPDMSLPGQWRTFRRVEFPDQATCQNMQTTTGGLTPANITSLGLVGQTIAMNYGLGQNGNQDNYHVTADNELDAIYTDFPSGWLEPHYGGYQVTFTSPTVRSVKLLGMHLMGFVPKVTTETTQSLVPTLTFDSLTVVLVKTFDHSLATEAAGDDLYNLGPGPGTDNPIIIDSTSGTPTITAGIIRSQFNISQSFGRTQVTTPLVYSDSTCCFPTSGEVETAFSPSYPLPTEIGSATSFDEELVDFIPTSGCGMVQLTHLSGGGALAGYPVSFQLTKCQ